MKKIRKNRLETDNNAYQNIVPIIMAVIIAFCLIIVGVFICGEIHIQLYNNLNATHTELDMKNIHTMNNTSVNFDSALSIINIVIIITILAAAIGAIFMFTRRGG